MKEAKELISYFCVAVTILLILGLVRVVSSAFAWRLIEHGALFISVCHVSAKVGDWIVKDNKTKTPE